MLTFGTDVLVDSTHDCSHYYNCGYAILFDIEWLINGSIVFNFVFKIGLEQSTI